MSVPVRALFESACHTPKATVPAADSTQKVSVLAGAPVGTVGDGTTS